MDDMATRTQTRMTWPSVDEIVDIANSSKDVDAFRRHCLQRLKPLVGCETALMQDAWPGAAAVPGGCLDIAVDAVARISANLAHYRADMLPLLSAVVQGEVRVDTEVLGRKAVERLALTCEVLAPLGLGDVLLVGIPRRGGGRFTLLNFIRGSARGLPYSDEARVELRRLIPVLSLCSDALLPEPKPAPVLAELSPQDRAIIEWLRLGYSNAQIALVLQTTQSAIKNRCFRLYRRVGVESRTELLFALGLVEKA